MRFHRLLSAFLAGVMMAFMPVTLFADTVPESSSDNTTAVSDAPVPVERPEPVNFIDIADHWARDAIIRFSEASIVRGDGTSFRPDDSLTRAEISVILQRVMQYKTESDYYFSDYTEDWYISAMQALRAAGVLNGYENNTVMPNQAITREEAVVLLARVFALNESSEPLVFNDASETSLWAAGYISAMYEAGYIHGSDNNCFKPLDPITRAEVVTILDNMITAFFYEPGEYNYRPFQGLANFVIIASNDVKVLNFDIGGDIIIAEEVDYTTIRLSAVNHYGMVYQYTPNGYVRLLKASSKIVPILENIPICSHDPELFEINERGVATYNDPNVPTYFGIDVSSWQGDINWNTLKEEGVYFAFIRVGYRGYVSGALTLDTNFKQNIEGALAAGIKVGVYFFSQALNADEAEEEARFVLENIQGYDITFPVVFDWELVSDSTARTNGMETEPLCEAANAFCNIIEAANYIPMIYSNQNVSMLYYDLNRIQAYDFWYAEYKSKPTYYYDFDIWQYGATAHLDGVPNADVDVNISFVDYSTIKP